MEKIIEIMLEQDVRKSFARYGIEGCEQKIKEIYTQHPVLQQKYLDAYKRIITGRGYEKI